jgi:hypothetical protein
LSSWSPHRCIDASKQPITQPLCDQAEEETIEHEQTRALAEHRRATPSPRAEHIVVDVNLPDTIEEPFA